MILTYFLSEKKINALNTNKNLGKLLAEGYVTLYYEGGINTPFIVKRLVTLNYEASVYTPFIVKGHILKITTLLDKPYPKVT